MNVNNGVTVSMPISEYETLIKELTALREASSGLKTSVSIGGYYGRSIDVYNEGELVKILREDIEKREEERKNILAVVQDIEDIYKFDMTYPLHKDFFIRERKSGKQIPRPLKK